MQRTNHQEASTRDEQLQALLLRGMAGDAAAYRVFLTTLSGYVRGFMRRRLTQCPEDVEDLVQEVLLAVHNARHTYHPDQPLTAWVFAIARYKLADYFRAYGRHDAQNAPLEEDSLFAQSDVEPTDARRDLGKLLQRLPDRQRLPIVHVKLEGLSVEQTSRMTGLSGSAVKIGIHRGLKALTKMIRGTRNHEDR